MLAARHFPLRGGVLLAMDVGNHLLPGSGFVLRGGLLPADLGLMPGIFLRCQLLFTRCICLSGVVRVLPDRRVTLRAAFVPGAIMAMRGIGRGETLLAGVTRTMPARRAREPRLMVGIRLVSAFVILARAGGVGTTGGQRRGRRAVEAVRLPAGKLLCGLLALLVCLLPARLP